MLEDIKVWNAISYKKYIKVLRSYTDETFAKFQKRIVNTEMPVMGVKSPYMQQISKEVLKTDRLAFLKVAQYDSFEETNINGLVIASFKEEDILIPLLEDFVTHIDNWAVCDCIMTRIKAFKKLSSKAEAFIYKMLNSDKPFEVRFGLLNMFKYMKDEKYLQTVFDYCNKIQIDHYYVKMAKAWLIAERYVTFPQQTLEFIKNNKFDKFTQNKAIQKIRESFRISQQDKDMLLAFKK